MFKVKHANGIKDMHAEIMKSPDGVCASPVVSHLVVLFFLQIGSAH